MRSKVNGSRTISADELLKNNLPPEFNLSQPKRNSSITCMNQKFIELFQTEQRGTGIRSVQSFEENSCIFQERPYAKIRAHEDSCYTCGMFLRQSQRFAPCTMAYCSKECYNELSDIHSSDCCKEEETKLRKRLAHQQLVERILFQNKKTMGRDPIIMTALDISSARLSSVEMIQMYLQLYDRFPCEFDTFVHTHAAVQVNAFKWKPSHSGLVLFQDGSFLNHSCNPNVRLDWTSLSIEGSVKFMAIKDIQVGEELCVSYVAEDLSHEKKVEALKKQFRFSCACDQHTGN
eukprot:PhF_6_TR29214/c0_g1_i2/m.42745/K11426/SMYD; SET and MYND domain-containing protein